MTPELWQLYVDLQTSMAYPNERAEFVPDEIAVEAAKEFYRSLVSPLELGATLLIGPGGVNEVEAIRRAGASPLKVLTAHRPEAEAIQRWNPAIELITGELHDMALATASVDFIYASNVLEHALAPYIALIECRRVLRDDGKAFFIMPSFVGVEGGKGPFHLHCLTLEVWQELLRKTGFEAIETRMTPNGPITDPHYLCYLVRAVTPPRPHDLVLGRLIELKRPANI